MVRKMAIIIMLLGISLLGCIGQNNPEKITADNLKGNDWCKPGDKISSIGPDGNDTFFEIKGIENHNGLQLCEADYGDNSTLVQYFNKDKSYNIMAIKTKNGTQEINVNRVKQ